MKQTNVLDQVRQAYNEMAASGAKITDIATRLMRIMRDGHMETVGTLAYHAGIQANQVSAHCTKNNPLSGKPAKKFVKHVESVLDGTFEHH